MSEFSVVEEVPVPEQISGFIRQVVAEYKRNARRPASPEVLVVDVAEKSASIGRAVLLRRCSFQVRHDAVEIAAMVARLAVEGVQE